MDEIKFSIIIPVYNGEKFFLISLRRLKDWLSSHSDVELIVVNDGSVDQTAALTKSFINNLPNCQLIDLARNGGKGCAVRAGLAVSRGQFVAFTDADLPYGLSVLDNWIKLAKERPDLSLIFGSREHPLARHKNGYGLLRQLGRSFFSGVVRLFIISTVADTQCGIKMFSHDLVNLILAKSTINHFAFDVEIFAITKVNGLKYQDFPVELDHRKESSVRIVKDTLLMLKDILAIRIKMWTKFYVRN